MWEATKTGSKSECMKYEKQMRRWKSADRGRWSNQNMLRKQLGEVQEATERCTRGNWKMEELTEKGAWINREDENNSKKWKKTLFKVYKTIHENASSNWKAHEKQSRYVHEVA
jgi:hypothetical protein